MCENTSDFSGVKVGDRLWSVQLGECEVFCISYFGCTPMVVCCGADGNQKTYYADGRCGRFDASPSLFWSRPEIIAPPRPKRKVVKTVEAWANVYHGDNERVHRTHEEAKSQCHTWPVGLVRGCIHLTGTYEVEE